MKTSKYLNSGLMRDESFIKDLELLSKIETCSEVQCTICPINRLNRDVNTFMDSCMVLSKDFGIDGTETSETPKLAKEILDVIEDLFWLV